MAKGYKETEQAFGVGDVVMVEGKFKCKVVTVMQDEDDSYWYEVEGLDFIPCIKSITREVPQSVIENI